MKLSEEQAKDILDFLVKKAGYEETRIQKVTREEKQKKEKYWAVFFYSSKSSRKHSSYLYSWNGYDSRCVGFSKNPSKKEILEKCLEESMKGHEIAFISFIKKIHSNNDIAKTECYS